LKTDELKELLKGHVLFAKDLRISQSLGSFIGNQTCEKTLNNY